jgi:hypothetical protein
MNQRWFLGIGIFVAVVLGALAITALYTFSRPRSFVALGTPIHQGDFVYTVTGVGRTPQISNTFGSARAHGIFYIVTIRVENDARHAGFIWDENIPHIVDANGHRWDIAKQAQAALDASMRPKFAIAAHGRSTFQSIFDVPADIDKPVLVFDNGILMGDVLNFGAYRRIGVMLY